MAAPRTNWRKAWVIYVEAELKHSDHFPTLSDHQVLAVLSPTTSATTIEKVLESLCQTLVLADSDSDRFDFVVKEAPYAVEWNRVHRHGVLQYSGLPAIAATRSRVRLADERLEWTPEPWPDGETADSFQVRQAAAGR